MENLIFGMIVVISNREVGAFLAECNSCDGSARLLSRKIEYGKGDFYVTDS